MSHVRHLVPSSISICQLAPYSILVRSVEISASQLKLTKLRTLKTASLTLYVKHMMCLNVLLTPSIDVKPACSKSHDSKHIGGNAPDKAPAPSFTYIDEDRNDYGVYNNATAFDITASSHDKHHSL